MNKIMNNQIDIETLIDTNSLQFLEQLYETYLSNPEILDEHWKTFFKNFSNQNRTSQKEEIKIKPSWSRQDWPPKNISEEIAAFDGQWSECINSDDQKIKKNKKVYTEESDVKTSVLDSIRALMFIRAYRVRYVSIIHLL